MANIKKIFHRTVIVLGCMAIGLLLGMLWAAKSGAADGNGLAGGAIVLGYGLVAALIAAVLGLVTGLRVSDSALQLLALAFGVALLIIAVLVTMRIRDERLANLDPPEAYEGIPAFALTLERTDRADPVLAKTVTVDSDKRAWTMQLPDKRNCSSRATAASLSKVAGALQDFLNSTGGEVVCNGSPESVLTWQIETDTGQKEGSVRLDSACLGTEPEAQFLLFAHQQVTLTSNSPVKCD